MNLYSSILCILYTVSICLLTVWYFLPSSPAKRKIDSLINSNPDLCLGIRITTTTALVIEFLSRLSHCIIWSCNIENPASTVLAVWMPQIHLLLTAAGQIVFVSIYVSYQTRKNEKKTDDGGNRDCCNTKSELRTFSNLSATAFGLFYMLFPTIVLMFAHPTQIIAIFTFVTAYLFATSIFSASIVKLYNHFDPKCNTQNNRLLHKLRVPFKFALFVALWLIVLYLHFLVIFASYSMLIGRGSVINTGPLFLISLLPSALLSGGAWFAKRVALNDEESTDSEAETGLQNELQEENGNQGMMKFTVQSPLNGLELKPDELESTLNTSPV